VILKRLKLTTIRVRRDRINLWQHYSQVQVFTKALKTKILLKIMKHHLMRYKPILKIPIAVQEHMIEGKVIGGSDSEAQGGRSIFSVSDNSNKGRRIMDTPKRAKNRMRISDPYILFFTCNKDFCNYLLKKNYRLIRIVGNTKKTLYGFRLCAEKEEKAFGESLIEKGE
jgi:hypothetical protein